MKYLAIFATPLHLSVTVDAEDEDQAADLAWSLASEYLDTVYGAGDVEAEVSLDGIGADVVTEVSA